MGLDLSLNNALSGLKASQDSLAVLSQNIANANNKNYTRQTINQSALNVGSQYGNGVTVTGVSREIDQYVSKNATTLLSNVSKTSTINSYYSQMQNYLGQPGADNSIDSYTSSFFNSLTQLSTNPQQASLKITAVSSASTLAGQISSLATNLQGLRLTADNSISQSVTNVNNALKSIQNLNAAIISAKNNNQSVNGLADNIDANLKTIAANIDITYSNNSDGTVSVSTGSGQPLVQGSTLYQLNYTALSNVDQLTSNGKMNSITLQGVNSSGAKIGDPIPLTSNTTSDSVTSLIGSGTLKGLLDVRDKIIPDALKQLDNMASNLTKAVNAIHNSGVSYPPQQTLSGQTLVGPNDSTTWSGSVMIAALTASGTPIASPYASDTTNGVGMTPLTIDLSKLNSGSGAGKPSTQAIIDQINNYYGAPQARAGLGDITNMQLVSNSDALTAGSGTYNFSLNLSNLSGKADGVVITGAAITGGGTISSPASFPTTSVTSAAGSTDTNIPFSVNTSTAGPGPYTVTLNVQTTGPDGTVSSGVVTYTLNNASSGILNNTTAAASATGSATRELPTTTNPILTAKLVDANGNEIAKNPSTGDYVAPGYLQISGPNGTTRVGINQLDSSDKGSASKAATGEGFSQFFGLNNFFNDNGSSTNAALNMSVRSDISANPQGLSLGELTQSSQPTAAGATPRYTYEVGSGSNKAILDLSSLATKAINFAAAGSLPTVGTTFSGYAAQILGVNSAQAASATDDMNEATLIQQGFQDKDDANRGVNIDEEMGNTIIYQNAYSANARVINVTKDLFQDLLQVFN